MRPRGRTEPSAVVAPPRYPPRMRSRHHDRAILALALPALGTLAADPLVSLVDTAFVGRLGALPLAALGVNVALFTFVFVAFNFLAYGTTPMVAAARGRGDLDAAGRVVAHAFAIAVGAGLLALAGLIAFAEPLLRLMGADDALLGPALAYLRVRALAGPALLLITAANGAFRGFQDTRTPFVVSLGVAIANLALDPLFIFGFGWGLEGAAWATVAAQWAGALVFVALVYGPQRARWRVPLDLPGWRELAPFARVGAALLVRTLALLATLTAATAVAARTGVVAVGAHQVAAQLWMFLALVIDALAVAAQALVARYAGEGRAADARAVADRLLAMGLAVGVGLGAVIWLARGWLPGLFTTDPAVLAAVAALLPFVAAMQPLNALVFVWDGVFVALQDFGFLAAAMLVSATVAGAAFAATLAFGWGLPGVWWALVALMGARAATMAWRYRPGARVFARRG